MLHKIQLLHMQTNALGSEEVLLLVWNCLAFPYLLDPDANFKTLCVCVCVCVILVTRSKRCLELRSRWGLEDASGLGYLKRKVPGPIYGGVTPTSLLWIVTVYIGHVDGKSCTKVFNSFNHENLFFRKHVSLRIVLLRLLYQTASNP